MEIGPSFTDLESIRASEKWALDNDVADEVSFAGLHINVVSDLLRSVAEHTALFPQIRDEMKFLGTIQRRDLLRSRRHGERPARVDPLTYAEAKSGGNLSGVAIHELWGKDPAVWLADIRGAVRAKFHPDGADSIKATMDHEMIHHIADVLDLESHPDLRRIFDNTPTDEIMEGLSEYGSWDIDDFISEAWSEFRNNPRPRPIARSVGNIILDAIRSFR